MLIQICTKLSLQVHLYNTLECQVGEFMCDNGQCILEEELCNEVRNCDDGSDEPSGYCSYGTKESEFLWFIMLIRIKILLPSCIIVLS